MNESFAMSTGAFELLSKNEMQVIDGGFSLVQLLGAMGVGAAVGCVGAAPGALAGALVGGMTYCGAHLVDLLDQFISQ